MPARVPPELAGQAYQRRYPADGVAPNLNHKDF
jgi:hypothetical protein